MRPNEPTPHVWARLRVDVNCGLRRGAWYRVVRVTRDKVFVDVARERVRVARRLVQTVFEAPTRWSVVPLSRHAANVPAEWGRATRCAPCVTRARRSSTFHSSYGARSAAACLSWRGMSTT
jgi:hypothetical protein